MTISWKHIVFVFLIFSKNLFSNGPNAIDTSKLRNNCITLLQEMIRFESVSGNEKELGSFLIDKCKELGLYTSVLSNEDSAFNFSASLYPLHEKKPNIGFINHMDVVDVSSLGLWRQAPYEGKIIKDTIWGRGAIDMKGVAAMQLMALSAYVHEAKERPLPYNFSILFLSGEESGGKMGAKIVSEELLDTLNLVCLFGEGGVGLSKVLPSKPQKLVFFMSVAEKKSLWLKLKLKLDAQAHAAVPTSKNANKIMFKAVSRFEQRKPEINFSKTSRKMFKMVGEANGGFQGFVLKHINWIVFRPFRRKILSREPLLLSTVTNTIQLTSIQNPFCAPNQIACQVAAIYDCRLLPAVNTKYFLKNVFFKLINPKIEVEVIDESPGAKPSEINTCYKVMENALKDVYPDCEVIPTLFPASTDNNYFRAQDIPTYGIMPIELDQELLESIHGPNERIAAATVLKGIKAYQQFIRLMIKEEAIETVNYR